MKQQNISMRNNVQSVQGRNIRTQNIKTQNVRNINITGKSYQKNTANINRPPRPARTRPGNNPKGKKVVKRKIGCSKSLIYFLITVLTIYLLIFAIAKALGRDNKPATDNSETTAKRIEPTVHMTANADNIYKASYEYDRNTITIDDEIASNFAVLIDLQTNKVVAQKNGSQKIYPASMTKIMTLLVAVENTKDLNDTFKMTNTIIDPLYESGASLAGFNAGEDVRIMDLLYGLILPSGADAADALAHYVSGDVKSFAKLMNEKVEELGLKNTNFANPSGLHDPNQYSTPYDMAVILDAAMRNDICCKVLSTYQYTTPPTDKNPKGILLQSTLFSRMEGSEPNNATVIAGKTGYTNEALNCLATYAETDDDNRKFIFVTAYAPAPTDPINDCIKIYSEYLNN